MQPYFPHSPSLPISDRSESLHCKSVQRCLAVTVLTSIILQIDYSEPFCLYLNIPSVFFFNPCYSFLIQFFQQVTSRLEMGDPSEVITLSDSDDDLMVIEEKIISNPRSVDNGQGATVNISKVKQLDIEQLGFKQPTVSYIGNQPQTSVVRNTSMLVPRNTRRFIGGASSSRAQPTQTTVAPTSRDPSALQRPVRSIPVGSAIRSGARCSPAAALPKPTQPSSSRTRNALNNGHSVYRGHFMFEATEKFEPSRRSSRLNSKKIEGKFVCSYNNTSCHDLCDGAVGFINHTWSHVIHDPLESMKRKEAQENGLYMHSTDFAALSTNSTMALMKMRTCEYCNVGFSSRYFKQQHVVKCHLNQGESNTVCNICELDYETPKKLEAHLNLHPAGESPYHCKKCKYRTSVRLYLYDHFIEKHINDALICPLCLYQEDLKTTVRHSKHIFVPSFVDHMRKHAANTSFRCRMCALSFSERKELDAHRINDHTRLNNLWAVTERPDICKGRRERIIRRPKVNGIEKKFLKTTEGRRVTDEISCDGNKERAGYDSTSNGNTLLKCECGFSSWNGNRMASHLHRCQKSIKSVERHREGARNGNDPAEELEMFAVIPQPTSTEIETKALEEENLRKLHLEKETPNKIRTNDIFFEPIDDLILLKLLANDNKDNGTQIINACISSILECEMN
ncbi:hypothetical protein L5515_001527 [Caenorhabditis briggsae]|uniref:C2H2-type domain-containing protein n=2 Tax=Caenorhabditis briggsae TaxID=6238 RepID=A0AAE9E3B1_CAEBR|nr:hypothetical protein L5515_001527 [Caenorhabditis briggsae]